MGREKLPNNSLALCGFLVFLSIRFHEKCVLGNECVYIFYFVNIVQMRQYNWLGCIVISSVANAVYSTIKIYFVGQVRFGKNKEEKMNMKQSSR